MNISEIMLMFSVVSFKFLSLNPEIYEDSRRQALFHPSLTVADFVYIYRTDKDLGSGIYGLVASICVVSSDRADSGAVARIKPTIVRRTLGRKNSCIRFARVQPNSSNI
jgi:hypothetical protein